jgi:hypothetical protein
VPDSQPDRSRRRLLWILLTSLLIAVILGVMIAGRGDLPGFNARVAALRAAGQPVRHTDLPGSIPPPPGLTREILQLDQALERLDNRLTTPGNHQYWHKSEATNAAFFRETEELRRELHPLLATDPVLRSLLEARLAPGGPMSFGEALSISSRVFNVEQWLLASSTHNLQQGQIDNAVDCFTDAVRLRTRPLPVRGTFLWSFDAGHYSRVAIQLLESGTLTPKQCLQLQQAFTQLDQTPFLRDHLLVDRVRFISEAPILATIGAFQFSNVRGLRGRMFGALGWLRHRMIVYLGFYDRAASLALDNYAAQLDALDRIGDPNVLQQLQLCEARIKSEPRWVREVYVGHPIAVHNGAIVIKANARLGLLAVAAHRYRLDHNGAFPTTPSDLVPRYLPTLPTDPFAGGPPIFQRLDPGLGIGFDRSAHTGMNSPAPTEPGGPKALLHLTR